MENQDLSNVGVIGTGKYIPSTVVTNEQIHKWSGKSPQEIIEKTGIETRYVVAEGEAASDMAAAASKEAIQNAGIQPEQIGLIATATFSSDYIFPAMSCKVQNLIGARNAGSFDLMANCTGFQVAISMMASYMMNDSSIEYGLVIGSALQSPYLRWDKPDNAYFFGDGAGAAVLGRVPKGYGILSNEIFTNSRVYEAVRLRGGGSSYPLRPENIQEGLQYYEMDGLEVWKQLIQYLPKAIQRAVEKAGLKIDDIDFFIYHQANLRLIEYLMAKMKLPMEKTYTNVARYGNTADASLAIALSEAVGAGKIKRGDNVVIAGVGAGFTFGASVLRWY